MKYSYLTLVLLNLAAAGATAGVYFMHINLWHAQGIVLFAFLGTAVNGFSFLGFAFSLLLSHKKRWVKKFLLTALFLLLFLMHMGVIGYIFWQRYFSV